ncbi:MAG: hypothetical protein EA404_14275 [Spirochaetaceae bacterium]|nr:MAG: hypothetical protein EA404_14275 [Spirochaetaceae bacterium]
MHVSRSLVVRFSRDMVELYTDLLGLGEAVDSGALFVASQRLVEAVTACDDSAEASARDSAATVVEDHRGATIPAADESFASSTAPIPAIGDPASPAGPTPQFRATALTSSATRVLTAQVLATNVLLRLRNLDERGLIPRPGRKRRLYGLVLSILRAACANQPDVEACSDPTEPALLDTVQQSI